MATVIFKFKYHTAIYFLAFLLVQSCNNSETPKPVATKNADDTINYSNDAKKQHDGSFNNLPADEEKAERQKMILMQIDSTYTAIALLDEVKSEMTELSPETLTTAERNKKSKAIFNINIIENELTRALDASILANLRLKTDELEGISRELEKNVSHLKTVTQKLNKATQCIGRLTNILAMGLSKGFIKPITPRGASAAAIKSGLN